MIDPLRVNLYTKDLIKIHAKVYIGSGEVQIFKALFMLKVTGSWSKVTRGSDHDVAQLHHGRNNCAQFELLPV